MGEEQLVIRRLPAESNSRVKTMSATDTQPERISSDLSRITATQTVFLDITQTLGVSFVPDLFLVMSDRPAYLEKAWELFKEELYLEHLDHSTKLIIALAITTNEAGMYFATALPHAFRLNALDQATYRKLVSTIRFFKAFDRYLSGVMPSYIPDTPAFLSACLRDEYEGFNETTPAHVVPSGETIRLTGVRLVGLLLIIFLLLPIAIILYLFVT
jgi:hypothetical protein